jgi:hypothetical protein
LSRPAKTFHLRDCGPLWGVAWAAVPFRLLGVVFLSWGTCFLARLFMIQHDCGRGSIFCYRLANDWVGRFLGVLTLTPYDDLHRPWRRLAPRRSDSVGPETRYSWRIDARRSRDRPSGASRRRSPTRASAPWLCRSRRGAIFDRRRGVGRVEGASQGCQSDSEAAVGGPSPDFRCGSMLLKKVFRGVERIFSEALVPWSENDVGGHIISPIFNQRPS